MPTLRTVLPVAAALATLAAAGPAHADGLYFEESFGVTRFDDELASYLPEANSLRLGVGYRAGSFAAAVSAGVEDSTDFDSFVSANRLGLDVKYLRPLARRVEAYARGSMSKLAIDGGDLSGHVGRGLGVGAGLQVEVRVPLLAALYPPLALACLLPKGCGVLGPTATLAAFTDVGYDFYRLHGAGAAVDADARSWRVGVALGADF
jgi:hypothetical protein